MTTLSAEKTEFIKNVFRERGWNNIDVKISGNTQKGDGYLGIVQFVTVTNLDEDENGNKKIDLVLKSAQIGEKFREQAPVHELYQREIYFYETLIPEFMIFQNKKAILNPFTGVAKVYGSLLLENHEALLLENLKQSGYTLWNRKVPMNGDHASIVLREYGKFHATSLAMRHLEREKFDDLTKDMQSVFEGTMTEKQLPLMVKMQFESGFEALGDASPNAKRGLGKFAQESGHFFMKELKNEEDHLVVLHGDCWCNNMMFKYEDNNNPTKPTKICLLDWQISQKASPAQDLSYFLFSSASLEVLNDISKYLKIYHDTITENLRNFGCDPDEVFPYDLLLTHWRKYARFGFYMAMTVTKILLGDSEDAIDFVEMANEGKNMLEALYVKPGNPEVLKNYNKRVLDLANYMADNDLF